jgi:hypothetical protein
MIKAPVSPVRRTAGGLHLGELSTVTDRSTTRNNECRNPVGCKMHTEFFFGIDAAKVMGLERLKNLEVSRGRRRLQLFFLETDNSSIMLESIISLAAKSCTSLRFK